MFTISLHDYSKKIKNKLENNQQANIFAYQVQNPENFGVVEIGIDGKPVSLEEKPNYSKSRWAVTGIYMYPKDASKLTKTINPSSRGELEITALNNVYLGMERLNCKTLGRGYAWLDTGTADSLLEAGQFVETIEKRQGFKISCLEEIAWRNKWISRKTLELTITQNSSSSYGKYLYNLLNS